MDAALHFVDKPLGWLVSVAVILLTIFLVNRQKPLHWPKTAREKIGWSAIAAALPTILTIVHYVGDFAGDVVKDTGRDLLKDYIRQHQEGKPNTGAPAPEQSPSTGSIDKTPDCLPEPSASAIFRTLRAMPKASRSERYSALFAGKQICANGWAGTVNAPPRKDATTGEWVVQLGGSVELRSKNEVWGKVFDGQRLRYSGRLTALTEQDTLIVSDGEIAQMLPQPVPKPVAEPAPKPSWFEGLFEKAPPPQTPSP